MSDMPPRSRRVGIFPRQGQTVDDDDLGRYRRRLGSLLRQSRRSIEPPVSQKDIAEYLGVAQSAVSDWERGESWPSVIFLLVLLHVLHIDPAVLLEVLADDRPNGGTTEAA